MTIRYLTSRKLVFPTKSILDEERRINSWLGIGACGSITYGRARIGKTVCMKYVAESIRNQYGSREMVIIWNVTDHPETERNFYASILMAMGYECPRYSTALILKERVLNELILRAHENPFKKAVQLHSLRERIECLNKILPQWYIDKMEIFAHMDYNTARSYFGTYHMRICPKCLKDGYHSIIHQFHYVKTCPFHPGTGTDGRFVFEHNFYHAEGIRCSPYEKGTGFNAYLLPLPCCRTNPNDFYDTDVTLLELAR